MIQTIHHDYLEMVVEILHTGNWLDSKISKILKEYGITHMQFNILRILEKAHPDNLNVGSIKDCIVFSNSDITRLLDRLKNKELIKRTVCEFNRRKMNVKISQKGLNLIQSVMPLIAKELEGFFFEKINYIEREQLMNFLQRLKE